MCSSTYSLRGGAVVHGPTVNNTAAKLRSILPILFLGNHLFTRADGQEENKEEATCQK
jgi:hypothetical protein